MPAGARSGPVSRSPDRYGAGGVDWCWMHGTEIGRIRKLKDKLTDARMAFHCGEKSLVGWLAECIDTREL